jgi:cytochrome c peroxidase
MSFSALRLTSRRAFAAARAAPARATATPFRNTAFRGYSTAPEAGKSSGGSSALWWGLGIATLAGAGGYVYYSDSDVAKEAGTAAKSGAQIAKAAVNFVPTKEDYQKVYNRIAEHLDAEYEGRHLVKMRVGWGPDPKYDY